MAAGSQRGERRTEALSKERIVEAAIEILDAQGEAALTFRALTTRLTTGAGAIYWHVANKNELLVAATDDIVARAVGTSTDRTTPREAVRAVALGVFDAIDAHPWVGSQLSREPWQPAVLQILAAIGAQLEAAGVPERAQFDCASALLSYILGLAAQYAAAARLVTPDTDRTAFLASISAKFTQLDAPTNAFMQRVATQLSEHDDREQFLAGVELILVGIDAVH